MENSTCYSILPGNAALANCISIKVVHEMIELLTASSQLEQSSNMSVMFVSPTEIILTIDGVEFKLKEMISVESEPTTIVAVSGHSMNTRAIVGSKFAADSAYSGAQRCWNSFSCLSYCCC